MLSILLLGPPQVLLDGKPLDLPRRKSRALLYYLAAHDGPLTRDHLLALFWPDLERPAAQQTLRTTLHGLRRALGPALIVEGDSLSLALDVEVDVRRFARELQTPNLKSQSLSPAPLLPSEARSPAINLPRPARRSRGGQSLIFSLSLHRGEFLEGFSLPDSPAFEDRVAFERERYRRLYVRGLTALSELQEAQGDFAAALDALDRALAIDPLQEDLQRAALRLHYFAGDRAGAIRRYEHLRHLLDEEIGVPPMAETRAVYDAVVTDTLERPAVNFELQTSKSKLPTSLSAAKVAALPPAPPRFPRRSREHCERETPMRPCSPVPLLPCPSSAVPPNCRPCTPMPPSAG